MSEPAARLAGHFLKGSAALGRIAGRRRSWPGTNESASARRRSRNLLAFAASALRACGFSTSRLGREFGLGAQPMRRLLGGSQLVPRRSHGELTTMSYIPCRTSAANPCRTSAANVLGDVIPVIHRPRWQSCGVAPRLHLPHLLNAKRAPLRLRVENVK